MADKDQLEKEIEYYTALIQGHVISQSSVARPYERGVITKANKYSLIRNNEKQRPIAPAKPAPHRTVLPIKPTTNVQPSTKASSRTVVKPGGISSKRTVLKHSSSVLHDAASNITQTISFSSTSPSTKTQAKVNLSLNISAKSKRSVQPIKHPPTQKDTTLLGAHKAVHKASVSHQLTDNKTSTSRFVWINKANLPAGTAPVTSTVQQSLTSISPMHSHSPKYITKSRYKLSKHPSSMRSTNLAKTQHALQAVGKYKLVSRTSPAGVKLTMKLKGGSFRSPYFGGNPSRLTPYISKSGKRIISRYKIRKQTINTKVSSSASPVLKKVGKSSSPYKVDRRRTGTTHSRYKIDKLKGTRKPVKYLTKTRNPGHTSYKWVKQELKRSYQSTFVSPFKLLRRSSAATDEGNTNRWTADTNWVVRKIASRSLQKSAAVSIKAKYKKNNTNSKHCMYYMRFGKCKRGKQCYYIHDPDRIAVCTRYLRGTCTIENCLFSHEAKKEKVPVCQHFLRGCCVRDNCPYLHVNVGKNAPICKSFVEFKYCHLGEKCKKLHTDICPNRDANGSCPKGNKCRLRHPKKTTKRMNGPELRESLCSGPDGISVPQGEKLTNALPAFISLPSFSRVSALTDASKESPILKNKPNFL